MMEEGDLPVRARRAQLLVQPVELLLAQVVAVEGEEAHAARGQLREPARGRAERVEPLAVHVEELVRGLVGVVVVAQRAVELDPGIEQGLVRRLELLHVVLRAVGAVHVVAEEDRELIGKFLARGDHLLGGFVLAPVAPAGVAQDEEADGAALQREGQAACGRSGGRLRRRDLRGRGGRPEGQHARHRGASPLHRLTGVRGGAARGMKSTIMLAPTSRRTGRG